MKLYWILLPVLLFVGCTGMQTTRAPGPEEELVGAWRSKVQFTSGDFAAMKGVEFLYAFNSGGTMTESSNYDGAPPVPPAYGVWKRIGPGQFEAKYLFFTTKPPVSFDEISKGGGWLPSGHGVLVEKITLSEDGKTFRSAIHYDVFDQDHRVVAGGGDATAHGTRIEFRGDE